MVPVPLDAGARSAVTDPVGMLTLPQPAEPGVAATFQEHLRRTASASPPGDEEVEDRHDEVREDGDLPTPYPVNAAPPPVDDQSSTDANATETAGEATPAVPESPGAPGESQGREDQDPQHAAVLRNAPRLAATEAKVQGPHADETEARDVSDQSLLAQSHLAAEGKRHEGNGGVDDSARAVRAIPAGSLPRETAGDPQEGAAAEAASRQTTVSAAGVVSAGDEQSTGPDELREPKKVRGRKPDAATAEANSRLAGPTPSSPETEHAAMAAPPGLGGSPTPEDTRRARPRSPRSPSDEALPGIGQSSPAAAETTAPPDASASVSPGRIAHHLLAKPQERSDRAEGLTSAEQGRLLDRVARAFRTAESRQGVVKLRLHPPELGALRIELRVEDGALTARLEAESTAAQSLLCEHAQNLRDRLAEQGMRVARFDVELMDHRSANDAGPFEHRSPSDSSAPRSFLRADRGTPPGAGPDVPATVPAAPSPGRLNVII